MTRKGLALGASLALLSAGLTSLPASAAVGIELDSNGTAGVFGAVEAQAFTLTSNGNAEYPVGNAGLLRVHVKNVSGSTASAFKINGVTLTDGTTADADANGLKEESRQVLTTAGATASTLGTTAGDTAVMALSTAADTGVSGMTSPFTFSFTSDAATTAPGVFEVTVFADGNNNGVKDTGELASATRTVTFYDLADVTGTVTLAALTEGDTTVSGTMVYQNLDMAQMSPLDTGVWLEAGDATKLGGGSPAVDLILKGASSVNGTAGVVEWDATNGYFEFTTSAVTTAVKGLQAALVKATYVKAHALLDAPAGGAAVVGDALDTATSALVATRSVGELKADTVDSGTTTDAAAGTAVTANVALNSTYQVKAIVKDTTATTKLALAGQAVTAKVTVAGATLSSTVTVTVNGTTHTAATSLPGYVSGATSVPKLALTTDANGEVFVTITTVGFADTQDVRVDFYAENYTAYIVTNNATITYDGFITNAIDGLTTTDGSAAVVNVSVRDQFGGKPADGKFRVVSDWKSSSQTTASTAAGTEGSVAVVSGEASLSILDNGTGAGVNVFDIDLATLAVDGSYASSASILDNLEINITTAAKASAGAVGLTVGGAVAQNSTTKVYTNTLVTGDGNSAELLLADIFAHNPLSDVTAAPVVTSAVGATIAGTVTSAVSATSASAAVGGAMVTVSAPGLLLNYTADGSKEIYAVGSITVPADKAGAFSVTAWSNVAGKHTVTITSGTGSATLVLDKFDAAAASTGTSLVITAPAAVSPGSTLSISATLTDKYGNPVATDGVNLTGAGIADSKADFAVSYTGPGLQVGSDPSKFGTDGVAKLGYFLGTNDSGTITVTFQYDANGDNDFADTGDLTVTKTIVIGTAGNVGALASWTSNQNDGTVKMYAKNVIGAGKVQFMVNGEEIAWVRAANTSDSKLRLAGAEGAAYLVRTVDLVEGQKNVLEIYVDGVRTARSAYSY